MDCKQLIVISLFVMAGICVYQQMCKSNDTFKVSSQNSNGVNSILGNTTQGNATQGNAARNGIRNSANMGIPQPSQQINNSCNVPQKLTASDLLPKGGFSDEVNNFANIHNDSINHKNINFLLDPKMKIGVDTVGQTLRNANLQLRSEPPNPQVIVSPWSNTTISPDNNRKPLEICSNGAC